MQCVQCPANNVHVCRLVSEIPIWFQNRDKLIKKKAIRISATSLFVDSGLVLQRGVSQHRVWTCLPCSCASFTSNSHIWNRNMSRYTGFLHECMRAQRRLRSNCASAQSDQNLCRTLCGWPRIQNFFMRTAKTPIRMCGCAG